MMAVKPVAVFLGLLGSSMLGSAQEVVWNIEAGPSIQRAVVVKPSNINLEYVEELCKAFLKETAERSAVRKLTITATEEEAKQTVPAKASHYAYGNWRAQYGEALLEESNIFAQLIAVNDRATLRYRDADRRVMTVAMQGSGLEFVAGESSFTLVEVMGLSAVAAGGRMASDGHRVDFFFTTDGRLSLRSAEALTIKVTQQTGVSDCYLWIGNDPWFVTAEWFPVLYHFADPASAPTEEEYAERPQILCSVAGGRFRVCKGHRIREN